MTSINNADMTNVMKASVAVMSPYPTDQLSVTVSLVKIDANKQATVAWSDSFNGSSRAKGSGVTLPPALLVLRVY